MIPQNTPSRRLQALRPWLAYPAVDLLALELLGVIVIGLTALLLTKE